MKISENLVDLLILSTLLTAAYGGYQLGLIQSLFKTIGYIAGGVAGIAVSVSYLSSWTSVLNKAFVTVLFIFVLATIGEYISSKIGALIHKGLLFKTIKFVDSLLGGLLSVIRAGFIIYLLILVLTATSWSFTNDYLLISRFFTYTNSNLPAKVTDFKTKVDQLFEADDY